MLCSMRSTAAVLALITFLASAAPARAGRPDSVHERVAQVLAAYGGWGRLAPIKAYRIEGDLFSAMRHTTVPTTRVFARPDRFKTLMDYPGGLEARLVDGARGWRTDRGAALTEVTGPMYLAMALQAARCNVPWILAERESLAHLIEPMEKDGVKLPGLEIPLGEGLVFRAWTDPVTHLVVVSQGTLESIGISTHFETHYSDFRDVNGMKFAFHEENFASGVQTGVTMVKRVVLNPPLSPTEFQPPSPPDSLGKPPGRSQG
jgi:hypothetical protein